MTRYEVSFKVDGRNFKHLCKQPDENAVKAKIKRAYPGKEIEAWDIISPHSLSYAEPLTEAA